MRDGAIGFISTPLQGNKLIDGAAWCADNGCFGKGYPGDDKWLDWLETLVPYQDLCLFATAPDVVGDAEATLERSLPLLPKIRRRGYRAALVAQDGMEDLQVPWGEFDALFVGGTTKWKLSDKANQLATEARDRGKHTHLGRVNSRRRVLYAKTAIPASPPTDINPSGHPGGYDSVDGTYLVFGPDTNLPKLLGWMREVNSTLTLI